MTTRWKMGLRSSYQVLRMMINAKMLKTMENIKDESESERANDHCFLGTCSLGRSRAGTVFPFT